MKTKPEVNDLDDTAKLPLLDMALAAQAFEEQSETQGDPTVHTDTWHVAGLRASTSERDNWQLADELIAVRDKILGLQSELTALEAKRSALDERYEVLQAEHAQLLAHSQSVMQDRERLTEERLLLLESNQQLRDRSAQYEIETDAQRAELQTQLTQQQQSIADLQDQLTQRHAESQTDATNHKQALDGISAQLEVERVGALALREQLEQLTAAVEKQRAAAAAMAQSLALTMFENKTLKEAVERRDRHIETLQFRQRELSSMLASANTHNATLRGDIEDARQQYSSAMQHTDELKQELVLAGQQVTEVTSQLTVAVSHSRDIDQQKVQLLEVLGKERELHGRARHELTVRQTEIETLRQQLSASDTRNTSVAAQLGEITALLNDREAKLQAQSSELSVVKEANTALHAQQAQLFAELQVATGELGSTRSSLEQMQERVERLAAELENVQRQYAEVESLRQKRDDFILEQSREIEQLQSTEQTSVESIQTLEKASQQQVQRISELEVQLAEVNKELATQSEACQKLQRELAARTVDHETNARQVVELQQQLQHHIQAINSIRHDIHKVAQQAEQREPETFLRTLVRVDDDNVVHLLNKSTMRIGRAVDNEIQIHSDSVSRHHANLRIARDAVIVEDMGSTNGCYVNGRRVKRQFLRDGDKLEVGSVAFKFAARTSNGGSADRSQ